MKQFKFKVTSYSGDKKIISIFGETYFIAVNLIRNMYPISNYKTNLIYNEVNQ